MAPEEVCMKIPCFHDRNNKKHFHKNSIASVETFISTKAAYVYENGNGWTYTARDGSFVAQHEHTIMITENRPVILTSAKQQSGMLLSR